MITLETLPQASAQDVYNQVVRHLLTQNCKSRGMLNGEIVCLYRGPNNTKCAAGCLISDEEMSDIRETCWSTLVMEENVPPHHVRLIATLQGIHDTKDVSDWPISLKNLGDQFELDTSVLDEFPPS